jgi:hypothetical protein
MSKFVLQLKSHVRHRAFQLLLLLLLLALLLLTKP